MATEVLMPKLSSTMDEGSVTEWLKNVGDSVKIGEPIFEVMTDKIAIEVEAYAEGILLGKYVEVGEKVPVNTVIAHIGAANEKVEAPTKASATNALETKVAEVVETNIAVLSKPTGDVRATPAARKLARENNIDLNLIYASLKDSPRVHLKHIQEAIKNPTQIKKEVNVSPIVTQSEVVIPWKGIRKMVADQMVKSKTTAPHVTLNAEVDTMKLVELRNRLLASAKESDTRISYTHLIAYFTAKVLTKHTNINARALDDGIHQYAHVNLGIATALDNGLIVPVIHNADTLSISALADKTKDLNKRARNNALVSEELNGGTFTITSLGTTEVLNFNPVINVPEIAILGVGKTYTKLEFNALKEVVEHSKLQLSLSFDHRAIDGYPAALFLSDLVKLLENPELLVLY